MRALQFTGGIVARLQGVSASSRAALEAVWSGGHLDDLTVEF